MKMIRIVLFVLVVFNCGGCTRYVMDSAIDSWQNQKLSEAVVAWGPPSEEMKIEGKHLFIWKTCDDKLVAPGTKKPAPMMDANCCSRLLEADNNGKIIHGAWEGTDCPLLFTGWGK